MQQPAVRDADDEDPAVADDAPRLGDRRLGAVDVLDDVEHRHRVGHGVGHRQLGRVALEHRDPGEALLRAAEVVAVALDADHDPALGPAGLDGGGAVAERAADVEDAQRLARAASGARGPSARRTRGCAAAAAPARRVAG